MMEIIEKRLSELKHPEQNVRMHSQKQIKEYCRSISKYGQTKPMVIDEDGVILIGNGLYDALLALGRESGSCMVKAGLSEKEKKKLMLADNRIYSLGVDNMSVFDEIIAELRRQGVTVLVAEQNMKFALKVSDRCCILEKGKIVYSDKTSDIPQEIFTKYLGV